MNIKRFLLQTNGYSIPSILIESFKSLGTVIILHGYGGNKEEQLGLGWRIAESGFNTCLIDLPGHGENSDYFDGDIQSYVDAVVNYYNAKKTITIGHSVGGRLALNSNASYAIGLSPTLVREFSQETKHLINNVRSYRVRQVKDDFLWELHRQLPLSDCFEREKNLIIFGSRDIPEISNACKKIRECSDCVIEIDQALHFDIYLNETVFNIIINKLKQWIH